MGRELAKAAKSGSDRIHVISNGGHWVVKKGGNDRVVKIFTSQAAAIKFVQDVFKNGDVIEYVVHEMDGAIKEWKTKK